MPRSVRFVFAAALLVALTVTAPNARAQSACSAEFGDALTTIQQALLSQGNSQKISTKVRNAWRMYASASQNGKTNALKELRVADDLIDGSSMKAVSADVKQTLHASIETVRACLNSAPAIQTTTLTVKVLMSTELSGESPKPVGANANVTVAGITAKTKGDSTATLTAPVGMWSVRAWLGDSAGATEVTLVAGTPAQAEVVLLPGRDTSAAVLMSASEIVDGVLPRDFATLGLRLETEAGEAIPVERVEQVEIRVAGTERSVITSMFRVGAGLITLTDRNAFATFVLERVDPFELHVRALDKAGAVYNAAIRFAIGRFRATAAISAPGNVSGANVPLLITHHRTGFSFWATAGANGSASFPLLPDGTYLISCETVQNGQRWYGTGGFVLNADKTFQVSLFSMSAPPAAAEVESSLTASSTAAETDASRIPSAPRAIPWNGQRIAAISVATTGNGGPLEARAVDILDIPERLVSSSIEELEENEGWLVAVPEDQNPSDRRPVFIRALDGAGREILRQVLPVEIFSQHERARTPPETWKRHDVVSFRAQVPFPETRTVEIRGWLPGQVVRWDLEELQKDPHVMQGVFVRKER